MRAEGDGANDSGIAIRALLPKISSGVTVLLSGFRSNGRARARARGIRYNPAARVVFHRYL